MSNPEDGQPDPRAEVTEFEVDARLHRGFRFWGFEVFKGLDGHWYFARLPVGYPHRII